MNDAVDRRASDALIEALSEGVTLRAIIELAMDDPSAPDNVADLLALYHDEMEGFLP